MVDYLPCKQRITVRFCLSPIIYNVKPLNKIKESIGVAEWESGGL
jgi:hypothetical protein